MKVLPVAVVLLGSVALLIAQPAGDANVQAFLKRLFPSATGFSPKEGDPPHFKAYTKDPGTRKDALAGLAFWTTELEPLERGYDGPIKILVGLDPKGILTGIVVADHHEPYGDFSIETPQFAAQFTNKNIRDPFRVGTDVDAVSRATITVTSAARAVRNSSRRIARQLLTPPAKR